MRGRTPHSARRRAAALALTLALGSSALGAAPASAETGEKSLVGGLLGGTTGLVGGTVDSVGQIVGGVLGAGWDEGATNAPTPMALVNDAINADSMWRSGFDGSGIGVAVIDSGVAPVAGLDGAGKVVNGPDLSFESQSTMYRHLDTFGHGTHMAGITAGNDGRYGGFRGVAPGAHVVNLKLAGQSGAVDVSQIIAAIDWVVAHRNDPGLNIRVLNLSYGTDGLQDHEIDPLSHAVESAWRNGIVVVVAGGNDGAKHPSLANPATNPYVLSVGAVDLAGTTTTRDDAVPRFSSRGNSERHVDLVAPGVSLMGLRNPGSTIDDEHPGARVDERYFRGSGTSQAAAVTSAAVALLLQKRPTLTPDQVKYLLMTTGPFVNGGAAYGKGYRQLDVNALVATAAPKVTNPSMKSVGNGPVDTARGTSKVVKDNVALQGDKTVFGPFNSATWAALAARKATWSGGVWLGTRVAADGWTGSSFASKTWGSATWPGTAWSGSSWVDPGWSSRYWSSRYWSGTGWSSRYWSSEDWSTSYWG
jgi:serine protease AprX